MELQLNGRTVGGLDTINLRIALLLWGAAGCGKTTLASTAPGNKLWIQFDPDGVVSLSGRDDVLVLDLSAEHHLSLVAKLKGDDPYGIEKALRDRPDIETVVLDSATALAAIATDNAVSEVKSATYENPGLKGYGHRNAVVLRVLTVFMRLTKRLNKHLIIISHEDTADKNEDGTVNFITLALGGKMVNQVGLQINEIWWMSDTGKERRIAVRPIRQRTPMKTRMFNASSSSEFVWRYDATTWKGDGIKEWFEAWKEGSGSKLPLPK